MQHLLTCSGPLVHLALQVLVLGLTPPPQPPVPTADRSPQGGGAWRPDADAVAIQDQVLAVLYKVTPGLRSCKFGDPSWKCQAFPDDSQDDMDSAIWASTTASQVRAAGAVLVMQTVWPVR